MDHSAMESTIAMLVTCSLNHACYALAEPWVLTKKMAREGTQKLAFTIPIFEPLPPQYYVRLVSDSWLQVGRLGCS